MADFFGQRSAGFPSKAHELALRDRLQTGKYAITCLATQEWYEWHAYTLGFVRVHQAKAGLKETEIDTIGRWFDWRLAEAATAYYRRCLGLDRPRAAAPPPADMIADPELAHRFREQDDERAALRVKVRAERLADGTPSPEAIAFVECCGRQVKQNSALLKRMPRNDHSSTAAALDRVREALGVQSLEMAQEEAQL